MILHRLSLSWMTMMQQQWPIFSSPLAMPAIRKIGRTFRLQRRIRIITPNLPLKFSSTSSLKFFHRRSITMAEQIYSLSIAARATLDTHSLNNEGGEGNQVHTRMIDIVGHDGQLYNVNAISGDMLKHVQVEHLFMLARERGLHLCAGCRQFNANRINADEQWMDSIKGLSDAQFHASRSSSSAGFWDFLTPPIPIATSTSSTPANAVMNSVSAMLLVE